MSGSAYNIEYIPYTRGVHSEQEAAGPIGMAIAAVAKVVVTYVGSTGIAAAVGASGMIGAAINIGAGALMSAGMAYASGARGADVWRAAGIGGLTAGVTSGLSGAAQAAQGAGSAAQAATVGTNAIGGTGPVALMPAANTGMTSSVMNGVRSVFGNIDAQTMQRIGAALVNAAVNGQSMGQLDGLVAQQRAELEALKQSDLAAYNQRISTAQQVLAEADRMDPAWHARIAMADVAGMEANQFRQAMRNIAVRQGGSLDSGQSKAYERGASLHTARSKALAYNQKFGEAQIAQNQLRGNAAQLFTPNEAGLRNWQQDTELLAGQWDTNRQLRADTWGKLTNAFTEGDYTPATSPDPSATQQRQPRENEDPFSGGLRNPFGGG